MNNTMILRQADRSLATPTRDARLVFQLLEKIQFGRLEIRLPNGDSQVFGSGEHGVTMNVHDEIMFSQILARGDIGLAEAYIDGVWDSSDLTGVMTLLAKNRDALRSAVYGRWQSLLMARIRHLLNSNSKTGSRKNIMAHYDLGNDFYKLWLDPSMSYSSALYRAVDDGNLETAQRAKYRRILRRLGAQPNEHVLEIGCGWGGFAEMAVADGLKTTGVTLSPAQLEWAQKRVPEADLRLQDYRDINQQFDHIVSIEMFEAVGLLHWSSYFKVLARCLKPNGRAVIQAIDISEAKYDAYRHGTDFIQQYIFPGGMLPSASRFAKESTAAALAVRASFSFGLDYAETLKRWGIAFDRNTAAISEQGFDTAFIRIWKMYLAYCEVGFRYGRTDVKQWVLSHA
jgi:cyclopropane-fatty-acyl-phospholipid synthase